MMKNKTTLPYTFSKQKHLHIPSRSYNIMADGTETSELQVVTAKQYLEPVSARLAENGRDALLYVNAILTEAVRLHSVPSGIVSCRKFHMPANPVIASQECASWGVKVDFIDTEVQTLFIDLHASKFEEAGWIVREPGSNPELRSSNTVMFIALPDNS
jgi:hypothetical protein